MKVILCLDDRNGMLFNHRRQSRDRAILEKTRKICGGNSIYMNHYSEKMFEQFGPVASKEDFLDYAGDDDWCFVENVSLKKYEEQIQEILVFRWNREYPADYFLDIPLANEKRTFRGYVEFPGYSHEKLTMEIYKA